MVAFFMAKQNDCELIEREYRTGRFSLAQIEARYGVNRSTQEKITRATLPAEAQEVLADQGPYHRELYGKHLELFRIGEDHKERLFTASNRVGKMIAGGGEMTLITSLASIRTSGKGGRSRSYTSAIF